MGEPRSGKQQRAQLVGSLRASGASWVEVAAALQQRYGVNARIAFRYAHGWSQHRAADEWNRRWPDELKTFKTFSYWELWPGSTGHAPSLGSFSKLAEMYECAVSDLLIDLPDFRHLDSARSGATEDATLATFPGESTLGSEAAASDDREEWSSLSPLIVPRIAAPLARRLHEVHVTELAQVIVVWMQRFGFALGRRAALAKLGAACALAAAAPVFDVLDPAERQRVARVLQNPVSFDEPTLRYCEGAISSLCRQSYVLGPQLTLPSVMGHRDVAQQLARTAPPQFRQRALSAYADLTQLVGWLCFNLGDYSSTQHYYDDARSAAHDAQNVEFVSYTLCSMSQLATWQGKPHVGIDHAVAAAVWAGQAHSPLARAYAADVAARAYAADHQPDKCREILDQEYAALQAVRAGEPRASWWDFYDESFYWGTEAQCAVKLQRPEAAMTALDRSLTLADPTNLHNRAFGLLNRAEARIQQVEVAEASSIVAGVARLTAGHGSQRIAQRITEIRGLLTPWQRTKPVRELDEQLAVYRPAVGSGNTKRAYSL